MLNLNEIKGLSPKAKAEIYSTLQDDPEVIEYLMSESHSEWLSLELERREISFMNKGIKATSREDLNKRLTEKWNQKEVS